MRSAIGNPFWEARWTGFLFRNGETQSKESRISQVTSAYGRKQSSWRRAIVLQLKIVDLSREGKVPFLQGLFFRVLCSFQRQMLSQALTKTGKTEYLRLGGNLQLRTEVSRKSQTNPMKGRYVNNLNNFYLSLDDDLYLAQ